MKGVFLSEECVICTLVSPTQVFKPCNHACTCKECALRVLHTKADCPLCRSKIDTIFNTNDGRLLDDNFEGGGAKQIAKDYATTILKQFAIHFEDYQCMLAVIMEALLFENPIPALNVTIENAVGGGYKLKFTGFQKNMDCTKWNETFLGNNRREILVAVTHSRVQLRRDELSMVLWINANQNLEE